MAAFAVADAPLRARQVCEAMDMEIAPSINDTRLKLKRLAERGILVGTEQGLFPAAAVAPRRHGGQPACPSRKRETDIDLCAASQLLNCIDHAIHHLGHRLGRIDDRRATAFVDRSHPRIPLQGRCELFGMLTEWVRSTGREPVTEGVLVDHQAHEYVEKIEDVCLVLRRPAQERDSGTRLLDEGLNALADDLPPVSIEPAPGNRIRGIRYDLAIGSVDPATEAFFVGVKCDVATRS
ncbi:hypothetical protein NW895_16535 [Streptomyces sp. S.PNR 29]|nr:hypothetical protein [Streptomyces sp. S.PNR 29]MDN0196626.1 hypothetical protein [Streptomyces sp. S.PNR 29]